MYILKQNKRKQFDTGKSLSLKGDICSNHNNCIIAEEKKSNIHQLWTDSSSVAEK